MTGVRTDRAIALSVAIVALVVLSLGGWVMYLQWSGNFHVVEPGLVYRSNTLGSQQLETVIATYGIKTIVNLRGRSPKEQWCREEVRRAQLSGVTLVDIPMSDSVEPDGGTLDTLLTALKSANRPILIHCKAGADRTGLASALFELFFAGRARRCCISPTFHGLRSLSVVAQPHRRHGRSLLEHCREPRRVSKLRRLTTAIGSRCVTTRCYRAVGGIFAATAESQF